MSEYVERKNATKQSRGDATAGRVRTVEDEEIAREFKKIDEEVAHLVEKKRKDFSFEVSDVLKNYPEIDEVSEMIDKAVENYRVLRTLG